jgi:hypothetical protein
MLSCEPCLQLASGRNEEPGAAIINSRTFRSSPERGSRAGHDGVKRNRGSKLHMGGDTLGHLSTLHVTPVNVDDRAEVDAVQNATGKTVDPIYVDQGYTGEKATNAAIPQIVRRQVGGSSAYC